MSTERKTCTKCGVTKSMDGFAKSARARCGRRSDCKACERAYRQANAEQIREYRQANAEKFREYRQANAERMRKYQRGYYQANAERKREYRQENAEQIRERMREYQQANAEKYAEYSTKRRALKRGAQHEPYSRSTIFAAYGGTCAYCDAPAEHLDHVVALSRGGADAAHNLLPSCAPCNLSKSARTLAEWALTWA